MQGLRKAIDNGGRFYNFLTEADDHVVTRAELAKAAGVFTAGVNAFLFLEMAQQDLSSEDQRSIIDLLESGLRKEYRRSGPRTLAPRLRHSMWTPSNRSMNARNVLKQGQRLDGLELL
jgi:hypothetical protein